MKTLVLIFSVLTGALAMADGGGDEGSMTIGSPDFGTSVKCYKNICAGDLIASRTDGKLGSTARVLSLTSKGYAKIRFPNVPLMPITEGILIDTNKHLKVIEDSKIYFVKNLAKNVFSRPFYESTRRYYNIDTNKLSGILLKGNYYADFEDSRFEETTNCLGGICVGSTKQVMVDAKNSMSVIVEHISIGGNLQVLDETTSERYSVRIEKILPDESTPVISVNLTQGDLVLKRKDIQFDSQLDENRVLIYRVTAVNGLGRVKIHFAYKKFLGRTSEQMLNQEELIKLSECHKSICKKDRIWIRSSGNVAGYEVLAITSEGLIVTTDAKTYGGGPFNLYGGEKAYLAFPYDEVTNVEKAK